MSHFLPSLIFAGKTVSLYLEGSSVRGSTPVDSSLVENIRQGWKLMIVENTLAYYNTATITAVKSFIVQTPDFC